MALTNITSVFTRTHFLNTPVRERGAAAILATPVVKKGAAPTLILHRFRHTSYGALEALTLAIRNAGKVEADNWVEVQYQPFLERNALITLDGIVIRKGAREIGTEEVVSEDMATGDAPTQTMSLDHVKKLPNGKAFTL